MNGTTPNLAYGREVAKLPPLGPAAAPQPPEVVRRLRAEFERAYFFGEVTPAPDTAAPKKA